MSFLLKGAIRLYQLLVSPMLGPSCRYEPTCSRYASEAIDRHGSLRGSWLALRRLVRCRPGVAGGYDPVPQLEPVRQHDRIRQNDRESVEPAVEPLKLSGERPPAVTR